MDTNLVNDIGREAIFTLLQVSAPILLIALCVGLAISLLQALTQIQETTLTFVPKILAVYFGMLIMLPYMFTKLKVFVDHIMQSIIQ